MRPHSTPPARWLGLALALACGLAWVTPSRAAAPVAMQAPLLGVAWYPEQWPQAQWEHDLALMQAAHVGVVRIGEFAWSSMEPSEGHYDFAWLDAAINAAARHHIAVVLGTPTAAPPAWLTQKYPDTLRVDENGVRDEHGNRQQFSFASPRYRQLAHGIAAQMARRYGHNPAVIGWQLDNELAAESFDPAAKAQFHEWLKLRYGSIAALNRRWSTAYWSQTYDDFAQIPVRPSDENPALLLDWKRFVSDTWASYLHEQISAIRPQADARQFITTNTMGWFGGFDAYRVHQELDIAAWDDYVAGSRYDWQDNAARHDLTRGYKGRNYWVMETQPGFVNWREVNMALDKGEVRAMAWQAVAHGADAVSYWQWRSAPGGQEQYHGVLVGADGESVPVYQEIRQVGAEFAKAAQVLAGTSVPHAQVALINDFDSRWAIGFQRHAKGFDPLAEFKAFYRPLRAQAGQVDVIGARAPLAGYRLVVAPALNVLPAEVASQLLAWVRQGGQLVLGPRSGMKDADNALWSQRQPGPLADALGGKVAQFYALDAGVPLQGEAGHGEASVWAEQLQAEAPDTQVLLRYGAANGWLDGQPALLSRRYGKGRISYLGAWVDDALLAELSRQWLAQAGVSSPLGALPPGVEAGLREGGGHRVLVLINHATQPQTVQLPWASRDVLASRAQPAGPLRLPADGVAVLELSTH